jgi:hypothetical protein
MVYGRYLDIAFMGFTGSQTSHAGTTLWRFMMKYIYIDYMIISQLIGVLNHRKSRLSENHGEIPAAGQVG